MEQQSFLKRKPLSRVTVNKPIACILKPRTTVVFTCLHRNGFMNTEKSNVDRLQRILSVVKHHSWSTTSSSEL